MSVYLHNIGFDSAVQKSKTSFLLFAMLSPFAIFALRRTRQFTAQDAKTQYIKELMPNV